MDWGHKKNSEGDFNNSEIMNLRICSLHFEKQYFKISVTGGHMLCNRAVPTVFVETAQKVIQKLMITVNSFTLNLSPN